MVGEDGLVCASQGSTAPGRRGDSALITLDACGTGADDVCGFMTTTNNSTSLEREEAPRTRRTLASAFVSSIGICERQEATQELATPDLAK